MYNNNVDFATGEGKTSVIFIESLPTSSKVVLWLLYTDKIWLLLCRAVFTTKAWHNKERDYRNSSEHI